MNCRSKYKLNIADELRAWEKTFPDELWEQFGRLTNWKGSLHSRPKWWGHLVNELIYQALDPDVADYLKKNKPKPFHGQNYHQWLSEDVGLKALIPHIYKVIGMAEGCSDMRELRDKVAKPIWPQASATHAKLASERVCVTAFAY